MPRPRVFVSSTYYDLKNLRGQISDLGTQMGFDAVRFEKGDIAYDAAQYLEDSCRREIESCDIVVCVIGGRSGSRSKRHSQHSITEEEVRYAHKIGKQLFFFIERSVREEARLRAKNPDTLINWIHVREQHVFEFIQFIETLDKNNAVFEFDEASSLIRLLKAQLSGLFQTLLAQRAQAAVNSQVDRLVDAVESVQRIVDYLSKQNEEDREAFRDLIFLGHSVFTKLQVILGVRIRVFFETLEELDQLCEFVGYERIPEKQLTEKMLSRSVYWDKEVNGQSKILEVSRELFDENGSLRMIPAGEWNDAMVQLRDPSDLSDALAMPQVSAEEVDGSESKIQ